LPIINLDTTGVVKGRVRRNFTKVERHAGRQHFHYRTRFESVTDRGILKIRNVSSGFQTI